MFELSITEKDFEHIRCPVVVVVQGWATMVSTVEGESLENVARVAIRQTVHGLTPPERWKLRNANGELLDLEQKVTEEHAYPNTRLFLQPHVGIQA